MCYCRVTEIETYGPRPRVLMSRGAGVTSPYHGIILFMSMVSVRSVMLRLKSALSFPIPVFYRESAGHSHPTDLERFSNLIRCFG